jgi:DNA (cytosine-5)-methyltransferase 1
MRRKTCDNMSDGPGQGGPTFREAVTVTFGSLFAGIGGFDLGLTRAGLECRWQIEIDPFCRRVLAKHWPDVRRHDDVRTFPPEPVEEWYVDLICGGFPCQDVSRAGKRAGIDGERSGLWTEYARVVRVLRPRFVLVENTPGLLDLGIGRVLADLASLRFDAEWSVLSACSLGAPHTRERLFLVAYPRGQFRQEGLGTFPQPQEAEIPQGNLRESRGQWLDSITRADRNPHGVPDRVDRLRSLGNAVVPQIAEWIGERLMEVARHSP